VKIYYILPNELSKILEQKAQNTVVYYYGIYFLNKIIKNTIRIKKW
jgi:hypothetical protein